MKKVTCVFEEGGLYVHFEGMTDMESKEVAKYLAGLFKSQFEIQTPLKDLEPSFDVKIPDLRYFQEVTEKPVVKTHYFEHDPITYVFKCGFTYARAKANYGERGSAAVLLELLNSKWISENVKSYWMPIVSIDVLTELENRLQAVKQRQKAYVGELYNQRFQDWKTFCEIYSEFFDNEELDAIKEGSKRAETIAFEEMVSIEKSYENKVRKLIQKIDVKNEK